MGWISDIGTVLDGKAEEVRRNHADQIRQLQDELRRMAVNIDQPPACELIRRVEITEASIGSVTFTDLSGDQDVEYFLKCHILEDHSTYITARNYHLRPNGDTAGRNQYVRGDGAVASAAEANNLHVGQGSAVVGAVVDIQGWLWAKTGALRTWIGQCSMVESSTPDLHAESRSGYWDNTVAELTSLEIFVTDPIIGVGSWFELYRRVPWV